MFVNTNIIDERKNLSSAMDTGKETRKFIRQIVKQASLKPNYHVLQPDREKMATSFQFIDSLRACNSNNQMKKNKKDSSALRVFNRMVSMLTGNRILNDTVRDEMFENYYYHKFLTYEMINAMSSLLTIVVTVTHHELTFDFSGNDNVKPYHALLYFVNFMSIAMWVNFVLYELESIKYQIAKKEVEDGENLYTTGRYKTVLVFIVITFMQPSDMFTGVSYSEINTYTDQSYDRSVNSVLSLFVLVRFYFIISYVIYVSSFMEPECDAICKKHFFHTNLKFSFESLLKGYPLKIYFIIIFVLVFVFSYSIRVFERTLALTSSSQKSFNNYFNTIWYVLITMSTVGYGDLVVRTNEARVIAMLLAIVGSFLVSLFLLSLTNFLNHSRNDEVQFHLIHRTELNEVQQDKAKCVVANFMFSVKKNTSVRNGIINQEPFTRELKRKLNEFEKSQGNIENHNSQLDTYCFANVSYGVSYLHKEYQKIVEWDNKTLNELKNIRVRVEKVYNSL